MDSRRGFIRTVGNDLSPAQLGHTQCHEHIWLNRGASFQVNSALCMDNFDASLEELKRYRTYGGGTIVDAQPGGFGRDLSRLYNLQVSSNVNIISVSGCHKLCFLDDPTISSLSERELAARFVQEFTEGEAYEGHMLRTGMMKLALDAGGLANPAYAQLYPAVARAAAETGAATMIHTEKDSDIPALLQFFKNYGVDAQRLLVCHLDRTNPTPEVHLQALDMGCTLCYDSIHRYKYVSDEQELSLLQKMLKKGYEQQIVLSLDTTNQRLRAYGAQDMGLETILTEFIPKLRACGVSDSQIEAMCQGNAQRLLAVSGV